MCVSVVISVVGGCVVWNGVGVSVCCSLCIQVCG